MTTVTAQEFNRDVSAAKRAAETGPVFVTNRGKATHVLVSIKEYRASQRQESIFSAVHPAWLDDIDVSGLSLPVRDELPRVAEFD